MNILLINGAKEFQHSGGKLNESLCEVIKDELSNLGHNVIQTKIDNGYNTDEEVEKISQSDVIIYQMPGWWMGEPWIVKKYIDEVFMAGANKLWENDGRSRNDPSKKYGSGGLCKNKKIMLSLTWNAPLEAFNDKDQFFNGLGVDVLYMHFLKAHEFLGIKPMPTFLATDVIKNLDYDKLVSDLKKHIRENF